MQRYADWQARLHVYLASVARAPLAYGQHDCALFAADAICAMTGLDLAARYRGRYDSLAGGLQLLVGDGFADHVALARAQLAQGAIAMAMPGDVAVFETDQGSALGVVQGASVYVLHPGGMLGLVPLTDAIEVFVV